MTDQERKASPLADLIDVGGEQSRQFAEEIEILRRADKAFEAMREALAFHKEAISSGDLRHFEDLRDAALALADEVSR